MSQLLFKTCRFITSSDGNRFPKERWPHIALIGRSNVGKSSLINHVLQAKKLAKVSATPGKTKLINFFLLDEAFYLVDLPGFGYAKVSHEEKDKWEEMIDVYFEEFADRIFFFHLIDARQGLTPFDERFIAWAEMHEKKVLYIFTKIDKINNSERKSVETKLLNSLGENRISIFYSIKEAHSRAGFLRGVQQFIKASV